MTDPAEPEDFCAMIGMESRTKLAGQSTRICGIDICQSVIANFKTPHAAIGHEKLGGKMCSVRIRRRLGAECKDYESENFAGIDCQDASV
ncbi:MAG: hypothetical protein ABSE62_15015 [Chthoniobacteraceae bacterium]|jgi:hypothetical protein